jgi:hypothetical protein
MDGHEKKSLMKDAVDCRVNIKFARSHDRPISSLLMIYI